VFTLSQGWCTLRLLHDEYRQPSERNKTMTQDKTKESNSLPLLVLLIVGFCAMALLTVLHLALPFPFVLDDEYRYAQLAQHGVPVPGGMAAKFPVFLYLSTFSWVSTCGEGFLQCARFTNVLFLVASLLPLYRTARLFVGRKLAVVIAILAIAGPSNTYTAYFMAESMYFFLFWMFAWFLLSHLHRNPWHLGGGVGLIAALLNLVKPHGLVLFGAAVLFVLLLAIVRRRSYPLPWLAKVLIAMAVCFPLVRFGLGYLLAGRAGLDLVGGYGGHATLMAKRSGLSGELPALFHVARGHLAGLVLLFCLPLAIVVSQLSRLAQPDPGRSSRADFLELSLLTVVLFAVFLAFFAKFTVDTEGQDSYQSLIRLHGRYYDFAFPLFLIITAAFIEQSSGTSLPRFRSRIVVAVLLSFGVVAALLSLPAFTPFFHDYPYLTWVTSHPRLQLLCAVLAVLLLAGWAIEARLAAKVFLFGLFPLVAAVAVVSISKDCLLAFRGTDYDFAARTTKHLVSPGHRGQGVVVGEHVAALFRSLFQLDSQTDRILTLAPGAPIETGMIAADRKWALIIGEHPLHIPYSSRIGLAGSMLVGLVPGVLQADSLPWDGRRIDLTFDQATPAAESGFYPFDSYCMWSMTESPSVELPVAVGGAVKIRLLAQGYGPNVNRAVKMRVGSGESELILAGTLQEIETAWFVDPPSKEVGFDGLKPASPADIEGSPDRRTLGLCLRSLSVQSEPGRDGNPPDRAHIR